jgi:hypothetical protein
VIIANVAGFAAGSCAIKEKIIERISGGSRVMVSWATIVKSLEERWWKVVLGRGFQRRLKLFILQRSLIIMSPK